MSFPRRTLDRALVAKLSDPRERLHHLFERAADERAANSDSRSRRDLDDAVGMTEVPRG